MTSLNNIAHRINELAYSWEQFKSMNDLRLKEIESKGYADSSTVEQLNKINTAIDGCKKRLDLIETAAQRPEVNADLDINNNTDSKEVADYIRKGISNGLLHKTLSRDSNSDGGYFITPQIMRRIYKNIIDLSPMRQICSSQKISTETLECIIEDGNRADAGWSGETTVVNGSRVAKYDQTKDTRTPQVAKIPIMTYELYAQPQISQRLLDDSFVNVESWLIEKVAETFSAKENEAFIKGDGAFQPKGILAYEDSEITKITSEQLDSDAIMALYYSLNEYYAKNASFLMNRSTLKNIRLLKSSSTGQYLWQPSLALNVPDTLMGVPIYQSSNMPPPPNAEQIKDASYLPIIAVADFKQAYKIVDSKGMTILRDPYTNKPYVRFFITKRVGGTVINTNAIKLLKIYTTK